MNTYELTLVLTEEAGKNEISAKKLASSLVGKIKGKIKKTKVIGLRDLAYPIKKQSKGWYGIFVVELPEDDIAEFDKQAKLEEKILRYLLVKAKPRKTSVAR